MTPDDRGFDVVVVGAGIAGLTAATITAASGLRTAVVDRMGTGGQLMNIDRVENFPGFSSGISAVDLAAELTEQATLAGVETIIDEVERLVAGEPHRLLCSGGEYTARVVILALGSELAQLQVPGEQEYHGRGVSYCATCDGELARDQTVAVIGGGDSAVDEALYLAEIVAQIHVVFREEGLHAFEATQRRLLEKPNVTLHAGWDACAIEGDGHGVSGLVLERDGVRQRLDVTGVFIYAGLTPNSASVEGQVRTDAAGHIETDRWMRTSVPGVYAVGDVRAHSAKLLVTAAGDGATAAVAAAEYLGRRAGPASTWASPGG